MSIRLLSLAICLAVHAGSAIAADYTVKETETEIRRRIKMTRNEEMWSLHKTGWSVSELSTRFGLTTTRIYQIFKEPKKLERAAGIARRAGIRDELCVGVEALTLRRAAEPEFKSRMDEYLAKETGKEFLMRRRANPDCWQNHWS